MSEDYAERTLRAVIDPALALLGEAVAPAGDSGRVALDEVARGLRPADVTVFLDKPYTEARLSQALGQLLEDDGARSR